MQFITGIVITSSLYHWNCYHYCSAILGNAWTPGTLTAVGTITFKFARLHHRLVRRLCTCGSRIWAVAKKWIHLVSFLRGRLDMIFIGFISVDGQFSEWSAWFACPRMSSEQGEGCQCRQRSCNNPRPRNGGALCAGPTTQVSNCTRKILIFRKLMIVY